MSISLIRLGTQLDTGHAEASLEPQPFARRGRASWKYMIKACGMGVKSLFVHHSFIYLFLHVYLLVS